MGLELTMVYWDIIRFSFLRFFSYPFEILAVAFKRVAELIFFYLLWRLIAQNISMEIPFYKVVSYFFLSIGISDLTMAKWGEFSGYLGMYIKTGQISNYMIKPINLAFAVYSISLGRSGMKVLLALILITIGTIINPPANFISFAVFLIFMVNAWILGYVINLFHGVLYFNLTEAVGIKNSIEHMIRIFSGAMVPLYFYPEGIRKLIMLTPFPTLVYGPANAFNTSSLTPDVLGQIAVSVFWSITLSIFITYLWRRSLKNYEAVGI